MKRMQATVSLKQLRRDPRHYVSLLNRGYEVSITDHRKTLAVTQTRQDNQYKRGTVGAVLEGIKNLPPLDGPVPDMHLSTKDAMDKARLEGYEEKRREIEAQRK